jgi:fumarate hydratase class II
MKYRIENDTMVEAQVPAAAHWGVQTNMNGTENIANQAHVLRGGGLRDPEKVLGANDDINKS